MSSLAILVQGIWPFGVRNRVPSMTCACPGCRNCTIWDADAETCQHVLNAQVKNWLSWGMPPELARCKPCVPCPSLTRDRPGGPPPIAASAPAIADGASGAQRWQPPPPSHPPPGAVAAPAPASAEGASRASAGQVSAAATQQQAQHLPLSSGSTSSGSGNAGHPAHDVVGDLRQQVEYLTASVSNQDSRLTDIEMNLGRLLKSLERIQHAMGA